MRRLRCKQVVSLLPDYLAAGLPAQRVRVLERHLAGCGGCRRELQWLRWAKAGYAQLRSAKAPVRAQERALSAMAAQRHAAAQRSRGETAAFACACAAAPVVPALLLTVPWAWCAWLAASLGAAGVMKALWPKNQAAMEV